MKLTQYGGRSIFTLSSRVGKEIFLVQRNLGTREGSFFSLSREIVKLFHIAKKLWIKFNSPYFYIGNTNVLILMDFTEEIFFPPPCFYQLRFNFNNFYNPPYVLTLIMKLLVYLLFHGENSTKFARSCSIENRISRFEKIVIELLRHPPASQ